MAKKTTKMTERIIPVTGLNETIEQITKTCNDLQEELAKAFKIKGGRKALNVGQIAAALHFGVAERRRRKLEKKIKSIHYEE